MRRRATRLSVGNISRVELLSTSKCTLRERASGGGRGEASKDEAKPKLEGAPSVYARAIVTCALHATCPRKRRHIAALQRAALQRRAAAAAGASDVLLACSLRVGRAGQIPALLGERVTQRVGFAGGSGLRGASRMPGVARVAKRQMFSRGLICFYPECGRRGTRAMASSQCTYRISAAAAAAATPRISPPPPSSSSSSASTPSPPPPIPPIVTIVQRCRPPRPRWC